MQILCKATRSYLTNAARFDKLNLFFIEFIYFNQFKKIKSTFVMQITFSVSVFCYFKDIVTVEPH